jgi:asparagine synthase (glutamine-hydrolysing)
MGLEIVKDAGEDLVVLGSLFDRDGYRAKQLNLDRGPAEPPHLALFKQFWGSYLAFSGSIGDAPSVARDPGGGLRAFFVEAGDVALVTDELPRWLERLLGLSPTIDEAALSNALAMPLMATHRSLLRGVVQIPAGGVLCWKRNSTQTRLDWSPSSDGSEPRADPNRMRQSVVASVRAWTTVHRRFTIELSGGLDSAIVLGCAARLGAVDRMTAINLATTSPSGDERSLARAAADAGGVELTERIFGPADLDYGPILAGPQPMEPNLYGLDPLLEEAVAAHAELNDCDAIITGQGGDAVFFQLPTARVALDYLLDHRARGLFSQPVFDAARRTRKSIWSVQALHARHRMGRLQPDRMPASTNLLGARALDHLDRVAGDHPWLDGIERLPPGKQAHALMIANCQLFNGSTRRGAVAAMRHPLMSQPVVEAWFAAPTYVLSSGTQDRSFARRLFQDLIPPSIARRRGKGDTSVYYRRALVENLPLLRSHLLQGVLVRSGLLAGPALDHLLTEEQMQGAEEARLVPSLASLESWARHWGL